ncbi:MAG: FHA domain-containing protein [Acidobacteria bacterium]|nr:MAG: FHA domain-containing protein [Acidobacteriota bacterium]
MMMEIWITYPTPEGSRDLKLRDIDKITIGRSAEADLCLDDTNISRIHATIYRERDKIWIIDENSTNGTFVNGIKVPPEGKPLKHGDRIRIGLYTELLLQTATPKNTQNLSSPAQKPLLPATLIIVSFLIFLSALSFIIFSAVTDITKNDKITSDPTAEQRNINKSREYRENKSESTISNAKSSLTNSADDNNLLSSNTIVDNSSSLSLSRSKRKFLEMSEAEKDQYVREKAEKISRIIGNQTSEPIPTEAVRTIRVHLQGYINRIRSNRLDNCQQGLFTRSDTVTILERARKNAPFIIRSFYSEGLDPQIGLYIAMIESEHCPCLQSPTGALGMFQFVRSTGREFGLQIKQDASPSNPDERCDPEKSARAAARYLKSLISRFGSGPMSFPLAIASYNSGQGGLSQNLEKALRTAANQERSFWTLVSNQTILEGKVGEQFRKENVKYVPKFFAAAIIGENPQDFGINMAPLSTYTN